MFIWIELIGIAAIFFLIANLAHYAYSKATGEDSGTSRFFFLSNRWLRNDETKEKGEKK